MIRATVSGSFHRHITPIYEQVQELRTLGVDVLSPSDPRVVDHIGEFLFVASDRIRAVKLVQDRHLEAIRASDFLVVVCPDGYTGPSTSGEIMAATVLGVPIYSTAPVTDITMREYLQQIQTLREAVRHHQKRPRTDVQSAVVDSILLDPVYSTHVAISGLERLNVLLAGSSSLTRNELTKETRKVASRVSAAIKSL
jgi:hypothetical protein